MDHHRPHDPATFSNYEQITVTHIDIEWDMDFDAKRLSGQAVLKCSVVQATNKIVSSIRREINLVEIYRFWTGEIWKLKVLVTMDSS